MLYGGNGLRGRHVSEQHLAGDVAYGIDAGHVGPHALVHVYESAVRGDAYALQTDAVGVALHAYGHQHAVALDGRFAALAVYADRCRARPLLARC